MDPAELDRYTVFDIEPTVEDWLDWAKENVSPVVWDFINQNRSHLEHKDDFEPNKVYPSRRSWKRLSDCLVNACMFTEKVDQTAFFTLSQAFCGLEAAVAFLDFFKEYERHVTWEQVVNEGQVDLTEKFDINAHAAMVEKIEASETLQEELTETQLDNLAAYFKQLPAEIAMKLWTAVGKGAGEKFKDNIVSFHARVREALVPMLGNQS